MKNVTRANRIYTSFGRVEQEKTWEFLSKIGQLGDIGK